MKQTWMKFSALVLAVALLAPVSLLAQDEKDKETKEKPEKPEKIEKDKKGEVIIINHNGDDAVTVEIKGDKIMVNGKPYDEYKDKDGDLSVRVQKLRGMTSMGRMYRSGNESWQGYDDNNHLNLQMSTSNRAMLGVTTEKAEGGGVTVQDVTKESAAEKAGLKENDVITKIDDKKVDDPDQLSEAIQAHKPGDKVSITYLRDKKEATASAELSKWKGFESMGNNFNFNTDGMNLKQFMSVTPKMPMAKSYGQMLRGYNYNYSVGGGPRLGLSVQDTDDGKGVKVIDVDDEGTAEKAGIKKDDIVTEVDGKAVNGADEMAKMIRDSKDKRSVSLKVQRAGKTQNIQVTIPHKIKTADL